MPESIVETYGRPFRFQGKEAIRTKDLEAIKAAAQGTLCHITTDEFVSVCPYSGLPDFATLAISYRPNKTVVELKSLKIYLTSFKDVGILQEEVAARIQRDLSRLLGVAATVRMAFRERGGIRQEVER